MAFLPAGQIKSANEYKHLANGRPQPKSRIQWVNEWQNVRPRQEHICIAHGYLHHGKEQEQRPQMTVWQKPDYSWMSLTNHTTIPPLTTSSLLYMLVVLQYYNQHSLNGTHHSNIYGHYQCNPNYSAMMYKNRLSFMIIVTYVHTIIDMCSSNSFPTITKKKTSHILTTESIYFVVN